MVESGLQVVRDYLEDLREQLDPVATKSPDTFPEWVQRYGPMVLGVCRRVLGNRSEAEDAFQATFLTVLRKLDTLRNHQAVAGWLHRIAYRIALRASQKPHVHPIESAIPVESHVVEDLSWKEIRTILDEELNRLPERLRIPLVLCYLDGISRDEAASLLGWSVRTLHRRLEEGRQRLHYALSKRGLTGLTIGWAVLSQEGLKAQVSDALNKSACQLPELLQNGTIPKPIQALVSPPLFQSFWMTVPILVSVIGLVLGSFWLQAIDKKQSDPKQEEPKKQTKIEKKTFWWGSEAFRHNDLILDSDLSQDGKLLATASWDSFVVWELPSGKPILRIPEAESVAFLGRKQDSLVRFSPDGKNLATANQTIGNVRVWEVSTGKQLANYEWRSQVDAQVAKVLKIKLEDMQQRRKHSADYPIGIGGFLDDSRLCIQSVYHTEIWDTVKEKKLLDEVRLPGWYVSNTKDRNKQLTFQTPGWGQKHTKSALVLIEIESGKQLAEYPIKDAHPGVVGTVSSDTRYLVISERERLNPILWDWKENKQVGEFAFTKTSEYDYIRTLHFSPNDKELYAGTSAGEIWVYDVASQKKIRSWKAHSGYTMNLHFAPDGKQLYSVGGDGLIRTWLLPEGKEVPIPEGYIGRPVYAWNRPKNVMVVGDSQGRIDIWDAQGTQIVRTLQSKGEPVVQLAVMQSGKQLASTDGQGWIHLWNMETGQEITKFGGEEESSGWLYNVLQFSDDETMLLVRTGYLIRMYRIPDGKVLWEAPKQKDGYVGPQPGWQNHLCFGVSRDHSLVRGK